jgi:hypothetical protein
LLDASLSLFSLFLSHLPLPSHLSLFGYIEERLENNLSVDGERINGFVCLVQSLLLGSFAIILAAHRSEILDPKIISGNGGVCTIPYEAPSTLGATV